MRWKQNWSIGVDLLEREMLLMCLLASSHILKQEGGNLQWLSWWCPGEAKICERHGVYCAAKGLC
jgi:hypothetical protein